MRGLLEVLDAELLALQAVLHALEDERKALERRDAEALARVSERKSAAVVEAAGLKSQREADPEYARYMQALTEVPPAAVRHRLDALRTLAARCQQANEDNGRLIQGQRRRVEATLNLLRSGSAAPESYDRSGAASYGARKALRSAC